MSDLQISSKTEVAQSVIVTTVGALAILAGMYGARESIALSVNGERTTATIVDVLRQETMYRPVFTFSDKEGNPHVVESSVSTSDRRLLKGQAVPVLYDAGDPRNACIAMWDYMWSIEVAAIVVGVLVTGMGVATMVRVTRGGQVPASPTG